MEKFIIQLIGHSCTGKSTLERELSQKLPGTYKVSYDGLKWKLSGYNRDKHSSLIKKITLGLFEVVCQKSLPILLSAAISTKEEYDSYKKIADKHGYNFISIKLTAPTDVCLARFRERVEDAKRTGTKITVTDEALFLNNISRDFYIPENASTFNTSTMKFDDIADKVIEILNVLKKYQENIKLYLVPYHNYQLSVMDKFSE